MLFSARFWLIAAAMVALGVAYARLGALVGTGLAVLVGGVVLGILRILAVRRRRSFLQDPGVSTLVFPPESKFQQSVLPPR